MIGHNHLGKNGRFGNQMFQYAATRGIAAMHGYDWCIPDGPKQMMSLKMRRTNINFSWHLRWMVQR